LSRADKVVDALQQADSRSSTLNKVIASLNAAGIEFTNDGQKGVGVLVRPVNEAN
jgi:hypothetical protein